MSIESRAIQIAQKAYHLAQNAVNQLPDLDVVRDEQGQIDAQASAVANLVAAAEHKNTMAYALGATSLGVVWPVSIPLSLTGAYATSQVADTVLRATADTNIYQALESLRHAIPGFETPFNMALILGAVLGVPLTGLVGMAHFGLRSEKDKAEAQELSEQAVRDAGGNVSVLDEINQKANRQIAAKDYAFVKGISDL